MSTLEKFEKGESMTTESVGKELTGVFQLSGQTNEMPYGSLLKKPDEKRVRLTSPMNSGIPLTKVRRIACRVNQGKHKGAVKFCAIGSDMEWMIYVEPKNGTDALQYLLSEMQDTLKVTMND